ncbi:Fur family transcriptional regulator [Bacteroides sp. 519]|uniref:Fur family transcriptional regulator n=1 Tax=Bacteroides sp. 519 TaxID=2302937 RepID=UPI0013D1668E|nr:transcriptional repressor [Bacteroides sp. 519]NDV58598.1 transcriptional repressor [Bacteroides sp. 519]
MNAFDRLLEFKIKPSVQRMAIMDYLLKNCNHPTVEDIYKALSPFIPTLSKTTVYNTLKLFAEQGAVTILTIDDKNACFDIKMTPHAHFLCKKCGSISDLPHEMSSKDMNTLKEMGHNVTEIHYYYKGICKKCLKTSQND